MVVWAKVCELTDGFLWFVCGLYVGILTSPLTMADLKAWMKMISDKLKETLKLDNIKDLASKKDLETMSDRITAQGNEIQQMMNLNFVKMTLPHSGGSLIKLSPKN